MAGIIEWVPVPSSWITDNRMHISVSRGTLVPTVDLKRRPNVAMRPGAVTPIIPCCQSPIDIMEIIIGYGMIV